MPADGSRPEVFIVLFPRTERDGSTKIKLLDLEAPPQRNSTEDVDVACIAAKD
jgi:hypothetical protein